MRAIGTLEQILLHTRLYRPAQRLYHQLFRPDRLEQERARREFFSEFIRPGDLVFDIGANDGRYTLIYLDLGAHVVAVEPNPALVKHLRTHLPTVVVEPVAVGASEGNADLNVSEVAIFSSMATDWMERARSVYGEDRWSGEKVTVPVTTLDSLIQRHGSPDYVKVDVEGFEAEVLRGLTQPLRQISFEVQSWAPDLARESLQLLQRLGNYEFNISVSDEMRLRPEWLPGDDLIGLLEAADRTSGPIHADVFGRFA